MRQRLLIVDDEPGIVDMLISYFSPDYEALIAYSGEEALSQAAGMPDLILLDINMPKMDGLSVCQKIREYVTCPILFLTARMESSDQIAGFQAGADDYIIKPFDPEELKARIEARLRREMRRRNNRTVRFFGELTVGYTTRSVSAGGEEIAFSSREFDIIELLSLHAGQVFDRESMYERIWGLDEDGSSDTIMEHVRKIRLKLAEHTKEQYIETVGGAAIDGTAEKYEAEKIFFSAFFLRRAGFAVFVCRGGWIICRNLTGGYPSGGIAIEADGTIRQLKDPTPEQKKIREILSVIPLVFASLFPMAGLGLAGVLFYRWKLKDAMFYCGRGRNGSGIMI